MKYHQWSYLTFLLIVNLIFTCLATKNRVWPILEKIQFEYHPLSKLLLDLKIYQNEKDNKWLTILIDMFSSFLSIWFPMRSLLAWQSSTCFVLPHCERFAVACVASVSLNVDNTPCWKLDSLVVLEVTKLVPVRFLRLLWNKIKHLRNLIEGTTILKLQQDFVHLKWKYLSIATFKANVSDVTTIKKRTRYGTDVEIRNR